MSDTARRKLGLFEGYGVELEYMIVGQKSLDVLPICDRLIQAECGQIQSDVDRGRFSWSNELVLHVVELKTSAPVDSLHGLAGAFHGEVRRINQQLGALGGRLMPSAMHPWMNPFREMRLWPHDFSAVYEAFNQIFDCRGHGWANLQSVHLNLPFADDAEFARLHAAIRLILPLLPALAAASPLAEGRLTGRMDQRLHVYRSNSAKIPLIAGRVIPEQAFSEAEYREQIFEPMYKAIAPLDPEGVLQDEFLNARGAIARFDRGSIEIRVIDIQECTAADIAVLQLVVAVLKSLVQERWGSLNDQTLVAVEPLFELLLKSIDQAERAELNHPDLLKLFGFPGTRCTLQELWRHLYEAAAPEMDPETQQAIENILEHGPLARRISRRLSADASIPAITTLAEELCECLQDGRQFAVEHR